MELKVDIESVISCMTDKEVNTLYSRLWFEMNTRIIDQYRRGNFPYVNAAELAMLKDAKVAAVIAYRARASTYLYGIECKPKEMSMREATAIIEYEISFRKIG